MRPNQQIAMQGTEMAQDIGKVQHVALSVADESGARGDDDAEEWGRGR